ncbi:MAG: nucleotidyltransferase family protein [Terracidiphilus sp.]
MPMSVAAIVLAAGASRRLGQPKQLLQVGGETLLARAIRLVNEAGASPVIAVLGAHFDAISAAIESMQVICAFNERWERGIAGSIHAGLDAVNSNAPDSTGALLLTCDQPRLTAAHLLALLDGFTAHCAKAIVASRYAGSPGVPAVFPLSVFPDLRLLGGDKGARSLLANPPCSLIEVEFSGGEVDIDLPEDIAHLR